jgi:hypothetical protein
MCESLFPLHAGKQGWNIFKRNFTRKLKEKQNPKKEKQIERMHIRNADSSSQDHDNPAQTKHNAGSTQCPCHTHSTSDLRVVSR